MEYELRVEFFGAVAYYPPLSFKEILEVLAELNDLEIEGVWIVRKLSG